MELAYPLNMTREEALLRRADKLIEWLHRDYNATYKDEDSTDNIVRLINLIIYAFEASMPTDEWQPFFVLFKDCKHQANAFFEDEEARADNYALVIERLTAILQEYKTYISQTK